MIRLLVLVSLACVASADDSELMSVPTYLMNYILDCKRQSIESGYGVPVYQTNIKTSGTSQHVSLLDLDELEDSLKQTVHNEAVVKHVLTQVNDAVNTANNNPKARSDCTVENHIQIAVPPQEIDEFNDRVQMLTQQNNFLLMEQINTLFAFKLRSIKIDLEKLIKRRYNAIENRLDLIMGALGVEPGPPARPQPRARAERPVDTDTTEDPTSAVESSDEAPDAAGPSTGFIRTSQQQGTSQAQQVPVSPLVSHSGFGFMRPIVSRPTRRKVQRPSNFWRDRLEARRTYAQHAPSYRRTLRRRNGTPLHDTQSFVMRGDSVRPNKQDRAAARKAYRNAFRRGSPHVYGGL
ncbi:hypothetical protein C7M84_008923 [Penaeus vannamei]|uniref:Uncharacterized protein n=1 Tax=Penaeus vannamei TaxID=6689 RepID=A0A3R7M4I1_PENVA|nr:hypothetical protein C7M84_008923 [Penaeus vannamei]